LGLRNNGATTLLKCEATMSSVKNKKAAQKHQLIYEFATLFQPLLEVANASEEPKEPDYR
jgi:hypothetical protein